MYGRVIDSFGPHIISNVEGVLNIDGVALVTQVIREDHIAYQEIGSKALFSILEDKVFWGSEIKGYRDPSPRDVINNGLPVIQKERDEIIYYEELPF